MIKRSKEDWQTLMVEHERSGLTAAAFCRERGVDAKYFSLRKRQLSQSAPATFVPVRVNAAAADAIQVNWQGASVCLPASLPSEWVADFLKRLLA